MKKQEWKEVLETQIEKLKESAVEQGQEAMINAFYEQELERVNLFNEDETVGHKEQMIELFDSFQGHYKYENNAYFSPMAMFE